MARADYEIRKIENPQAIADSEWEWLEAFEKNLRTADRRELIAVHKNAFAAIAQSVTTSEEAYRVTGAKGEPLVLYGKCAPENLPGRLIWCMATANLATYEREFARVSKKILQEWAAKHGLLWNAVGEFNEAAKRWLKWCGAEFGSPLIMGGEMFVRFYIRGN